MSHLRSKRPPPHPQALLQWGERLIEGLPEGTVIEFRADALSFCEPVTHTFPVHHAWPAAGLRPRRKNPAK